MKFCGCLGGCNLGLDVSKRVWGGLVCFGYIRMLTMETYKKPRVKNRNSADSVERGTTGRYALNPQPYEGGVIERRSEEICVKILQGYMRKHTSHQGNDIGNSNCNQVRLSLPNARKEPHKRWSSEVVEKNRV